MNTKSTNRTRKGQSAGIVSSSHLVSPRSLEASEFEFGLIVAWNAFSRWLVRCMAAAGVPDLTVTDVLVLHHVNHRGRHKKLADISFVLNYEDTHVVAYSLKKLVAAGLLCADKQGKDVFYRPTEEGEAAVQRYRAVRADAPDYQPMEYYSSAHDEFDLADELARRDDAARVAGVVDLAVDGDVSA